MNALYLLFTEWMRIASTDGIEVTNDRIIYQVNQYKLTVGDCKEMFSSNPQGGCRYCKHNNSDVNCVDNCYDGSDFNNFEIKLEN